MDSNVGRNGVQLTLKVLDILRTLVFGYRDNFTKKCIFLENLLNLDDLESKEKKIDSA